MPRLRTSLVTVAAGGAIVATGVAVTNAVAAPTPVAALTALETHDAADTGPAPADDIRTPRRHGVRQWWAQLTDEQRQCLEDARITRPVGPLDDDERATLRDQVGKAADACDVELPFARARAFWNGLTDEQRQCLDDQEVTRPWGPMTKEQRQRVRADLRAAAQECGVELPELPERPSAGPASEAGAAQSPAARV